MSTVLRIIGPELDCDTIIRLSPVQPCSVHSRGEPKFPNTQPDGPTWEFSGVNFVVSDAAMVDYPLQVQETIAFLNRHFDSLQKLLEQPGIDSAGLAFGLEWRDVAAHIDLIPAELVRLAGRLGLAISLTHYACADD